jgi:hypothetical protein
MALCKANVLEIVVGEKKVVVVVVATTLQQQLIQFTLMQFSLTTLHIRSTDRL